MKKFLSILLAVMMVLSTVSFAAPSLAGTADTAVDAPVAEVPVVEEVAADLAATAGDESTYGKLIINIDFENFETGAVMADNLWFENILDADDYDSEFVATSYRANWEVGANAIVEVDGNKFIRGGQGWSQVRIENQMYGLGAPDGIYTYVMDVVDFGPVQRDVTATTQDSWINGVKVKADVVPKVLVAWDKEGTLGEWQTVAAQWDGVSNNLSWYFTDGATTEVGFDNIKVYYRPATVTLTIDGNEYEVSTDAPVTVASLASKVIAPTGYVLSGLSLTEGGELLEGGQYFFEDTVLYPSYEVDDTIDVRYGKKIVSFSFDDASKFTTEHCTADYSNFDVAKVADYYDASHNLSVLQYYKPYTGEPSFTNGYSESSVTSWGSINVVTHGGYTYSEGVYTLAFDMAANTTTNFGITQSSSSFTALDGYSHTDANTFDHVVIEVNKDYLSGKNNLQLQFATALSSLKVDNLEIFYKPNTVDVTLIYNGEEYVAEDVSTAGVSADTILVAAGVEIPYGKKAVLSATNGGESVGNVVNLVMDSTYFVSFVADDSISEYGKRLFLIDFEKFAVGDTFDTASGNDNKAISTYTDDCNGDWSHLTINWEVGNVGGNKIVEEDGNKFIKGQQDWAQIRINNANFESAPAGYYTMALKTKNFGDDAKSLSTKDQNSGVLATWVKAGSVTGTSNSYPVVNGEWNEVASELNYPGKDFTIYYTDKMTTEVAFDDIALYYRPASVNLTVVDANGDETVYEDVDSVVDIDELLADVKAPFGYKAALSIEKNGAPITGTLNLVSDAKLYVVLTEDETVSMEYGMKVYDLDFEGVAFDSSAVNESYANYKLRSLSSYYNEDLTASNDLFQLPMSHLNNHRLEIESDGNVAYAGEVVSNYNYYFTFIHYVSTNESWGEGTYTLEFDLKANQQTGFAISQSTSSFTALDPYTYRDGEYDHVVLQINKDYLADKYYIQLQANPAVSFYMDNIKLYLKPNTATVDILANGEAVKTVANVSTAGVSVASLLEGVNVKGYTVTGVSFGGKTYTAEETLVVPCDCSVDLVLEVKEQSAATPETAAEKSIRVDDPVGIRFKASLLVENMGKDVTTSYGWVIARADVLGDAELTLDFENSVSGYGRENGVDKKNFYETDDEYAWFTAVLFFSETETDGYPAANRLASKLVARPFAVVDGETLYGEPTEPASIYDVAASLWTDTAKWNELDGNMQAYLDGLMIKVEDAGLGA